MIDQVRDGDCGGASEILRGKHGQTGNLEGESNYSILGTALWRREPGNLRLVMVGGEQAVHVAVCVGKVSFPGTILLLIARPDRRLP